MLAERPPEEIEAQAAKVATIHRELTEARVESRDAEAAAAREQAQANRAARHLQDAEAGRPRLVAEQTTWQPSPQPDVRATDLEDRLG